MSTLCYVLGHESCQATEIDLDEDVHYFSGLFSFGRKVNTNDELFSCHVAEGSYKQLFFIIILDICTLISIVPTVYQVPSFSLLLPSLPPRLRVPKLDWNTGLNQ